jgi:hypothetical protein
VNLRWSVCSVLLALAACGGHPAARVETPRFAAVTDARAVAWASRDRAAVLPASVHHIQVVIAPGWTAGEHNVFVVAEGRELLAVYRATQAELSEVVAEVGHRYYPTVGTPLDEYEFIINGSFRQPPPPPPPFHDQIPAAYVREVLTNAYQLNQSSAQFTGRPAEVVR